MKIFIGIVIGVLITFAAMFVYNKRNAAREQEKWISYGVDSGMRQGNYDGCETAANRAWHEKIEAHGGNLFEHYWAPKSFIKDWCGEDPFMKDVK